MYIYIYIYIYKQSAFVTKEIRKALTNRLRFLNKFRKKKKK